MVSFSRRCVVSSSALLSGNTMQKFSTKIPVTRTAAREGINAAQTFFDRHGCVFQEVAQQNDFGKDAYLDIGQDGTVTHLCVALQIKSGESFRTSRGDYFIPVEKHAESWRRSTVPIFGLVFDPSDQLIRWVDITAYLRTHPNQESGTIPVARDSVLNEASLEKDFVRAVSLYEANEGAGIALSLLADEATQMEAVFDAWALGRRDARYLILLRRLILQLQVPATRRAIEALAHAGSHPDIFWTKNNWIPKSIKEVALPSFRWSPEEIAHMLLSIGTEEWGRGTLGQSFDVLMYEDPDVITKLRAAAGILLASGEVMGAVRAAVLALAHSKDPREELLRLTQEHPRLTTQNWFRDIEATVRDFGSITLY